MTNAVFELQPGADLPAGLCHPKPEDRVAIYLHGGAFLYDEPHTVFADRIATALGRPVLMPHYRIGSQNPYPAGSNDTTDAYRRLLEAGWSPAHILVVGHSAGGTMALTLATRAPEHRLPMPEGLVCLSGVLDFTLTQHSLAENDGKDTISVKEARQILPQYVGAADPIQPGVSPAKAPVSAWVGAPPIYILCGGREILLDDTLQVAQAAARAGCEVEMRVVAGAQHGSAQRQHPLSERVLLEVAAFAQRCDAPLPEKQTWIGPTSPGGKF